MVAALTATPNDAMTGDIITLSGTGFSGTVIAENSIRIGGITAVHSAITITAGAFTATVTFGYMAVEGQPDISITPTGQSETTFSDKLYFHHYTTIIRIRNLINIESANLSDAIISQFIIDREKEIDSWFMNDGKIRAKAVFGYGLETDEYCNYRRDDFYVKTLYPFIISITSLYERSGNNSWTEMTEGVDDDFYTDVEDKRRGRISLDNAPSYLRDGVKVTYVHGCTAVPSQITGMATKMAALDSLHAVLQIGEDDVYDQRIPALRDQIQIIKDSIGQRTEAFVF